MFEQAAGSPTLASSRLVNGSMLIPSRERRYVVQAEGEIEGPDDVEEIGDELWRSCGDIPVVSVSC
jgi:hypothetical protein